jgi:hypothetical protein
MGTSSIRRYIGFGYALVATSGSAPQLVWINIPEPGAMLLAAAAAIGLLGRRRRT